MSTSVGRGRWAVLGGYALLAAGTQLLWLSFAPITTQAAAVMHVDEGTAGDLAAIFPFVYVVLALPTGRWLDARFTRALGVGAVLTGAGALVRLISPTSFACQLAGQAVIAGGQPLVLSSITKVAARYFPPRERATAISLGSVALFAGILAAVLSAAPLLDAGGLRLVLAVHGAVGVAGAAAMLLVLRTPPAFSDDPSATVSLGWLRRDRFMWVLAALVFAGMGTYNVVATWLESILDHFGEGGAAGNLIAVMTVAGIAGAAVLPARVAAAGRRRDLLLVAMGTSAVAFSAMAAGHRVPWLGAWLAVEGFVLMASLPVVLDWAEVHVGLERQGAAAGFLMMAGNLGGIVLVLITQAVIGDPYLALGLLAVVGAAGLPVVLALPPGRRASGDDLARAEGPAEALR